MALTSPAVAPVSDEPAVAALAATVRCLALQYDADCLVDTADGRLVAHSVEGPATATVVDALLRSDTRSIDAALRQRRTLGLVAGGPVLSGRVDGRTVLRVPIGRGRIGALWLSLRGGACPAVGDLSDAAERLVPLLVVPAEQNTDVAALLTGESVALPARLQPSERMWVVAASGVDAATLATLPADGTVLSCRSGASSYAVIGTSPAVDAPALQAAVQQQLGGPWPAHARAAIAGPVSSAAEVAAARELADRALRVTPSGCCRTAEQLREQIVLRHLHDAVAELPALAGDPVERLRAYDSRRQAQLVETLQCWLQARGDVTLASDLSGVHHNTIRYRLKRIAEIAGVDLTVGSADWIELYLRLAVSD